MQRARDAPVLGMMVMSLNTVSFCQLESSGPFRSMLQSLLPVSALTAVTVPSIVTTSAVGDFGRLRFTCSMSLDPPSVFPRDQPVMSLPASCRPRRCCWRQHQDLEAKSQASICCSEGSAAPSSSRLPRLVLRLTPLPRVSLLSRKFEMQLQCIACEGQSLRVPEPPMDVWSAGNSPTSRRPRSSTCP